MPHEISEIECLKAKNFEITPSVVIKNLEESHGCHLEAMEKKLPFEKRRSGHGLQKSLGI